MKLIESQKPPKRGRSMMKLSLAVTSPRISVTQPSLSGSISVNVMERLETCKKTGDGVFCATQHCQTYWVMIFTWQSQPMPLKTRNYC